jgi:hypothetical protein
MKNEIVDFFVQNSGAINTLLSEVKQILGNGIKNQNETPYVLLNILTILTPSDISASNLPDELKLSLTNFMTEEVDSIKLFKVREKGVSYPKLIDLEWKFIGQTRLDNVSEMIPKVLVRLKFNNGESKIFETDFAGFKKLQEDVEEGLNSYNSVYSKRIESFAK